MFPGSDMDTMETTRGVDHIKRGDVMEGNRYLPRGKAPVRACTIGARGSSGWV